MGYSATVLTRRPARKDGTCQVRLVVIIDRRVMQLSLGIAWPIALFDEAEGKCLASRPPRSRPADYAEQLAAAQARAGGAEAFSQLADDYSLLIGQARAKANTIFVGCRLSNMVLTAEKFLQDFNTEGSKTDFVSYFHHKIIERHRKGKISDNTKKNHLSTWRELKRFREVIAFHTLSLEFADEFNDYLLKRVKSLNTRWGRHKDVKTYLALAKKDRLKLENPYEHFKNKDEPGKWKALKPDELAKLEAYYRLCTPGTIYRRVLAKFLFSCNSSLRLGDLKNIGAAKLENRELIFKAQKT
ncbi:phage integrase SAM-like domain-containing protein [Hymenobacter cheonanensis]|uniref:phage integrase SAM-like domain-containing protein n=1 Tax=Hymenobacter sp. CA2-7 TaxID=3063993 RepID=UPI002712DEDC|nr:phage integrase SAM-like domain-containing protein [Hymenobacter sp. CA2-7]MDO7885718.1 phage integrase SAM-like domain-containing protein [Hymenobacter sp. CA2-7]